jgi:hypothetical protein
MCPSSGSYDKDKDGNDSVVLAARFQDSQMAQNPEMFNAEGFPIYNVG